MTLPTVNWLNWPIQQEQQTYYPFLTDIKSHLPSQYGTQYCDSGDDPITCGHETTHGINAHLRNQNSPGSVAFYVGNNQACIMSQPNMTLSQIADSIPGELRSNRYQNYFIDQQQDWNDYPLYPFDEWNAYNNGGTVGLELPPPTDGSNNDMMVAPLEFSIYAIAILAAVDQLDPTYLATNNQFKGFVASELVRSIGVYRKGIVLPGYQWNTDLESKLKSSQYCKDILAKVYGSDLSIDTLFK